MKVQIEIKLYATLQSCAPADADHFTIESGTCVEKVLEALAIPTDQVKLLFRNGVKCGLETLLAEGDRIAVFPPVGGG